MKPFDRRTLLERLARFERGKASTVLVADDDISITQFFQEALTREGYTVSFARNGKQALEKIKENPPDILFLDLMMPIMSGFDVLTALDKEPTLKGVRVFVMTAKVLSPEETVFLEKRVEMILKKGTRESGEILKMLREKLSSLKVVAAQ